MLPVVKPEADELFPPDFGRDFSIFTGKLALLHMWFIISRYNTDMSTGEVQNGGNIERAREKFGVPG